MPTPVIAWFDTLEEAQTWRTAYGGWLFATPAGATIWFSLTFTPTTVMLHPATAGLDGRLV